MVEDMMGMRVFKDDDNSVVVVVGRI